MSRKSRAELEQRVKELEREVESLQKMFRLELKNRQTIMDLLDDRLECGKTENELLRGSLTNSATEFARENLRRDRGRYAVQEKRAAMIDYGRPIFESCLEKGMTLACARTEAKKAIKEKFPRKLKNGKDWSGPSLRTLQKHYKR